MGLLQLLLLVLLMIGFEFYLAKLTKKRQARQEMQSFCLQSPNKKPGAKRRVNSN